ncbi:MAG: transcription antitermination factor NusB [Gemmatimonadaceae bacterium]|nr:transcription antitermination factor NusB [Gemmatimonadaceae bacterium]MCW5824996.1 transcription antitermination factor NusB [Gemmatimonadaceae bacterium]
MARVETRGRVRALQALYAWDVRKESTPLPRVAHLVWDDLAIAPDEREFAERLIQLIVADQPTMDAELAEVTTNWRLERLGHIERCVLRLGAAELTQGGTPPRVVIQECVRLAERFGSGPSARFVNGVLDALARRMGQLS